MKNFDPRRFSARDLRMQGLDLFTKARKRFKPDIKTPNSGGVVGNPEEKIDVNIDEIRAKLFDLVPDFRPIGNVLSPDEVMRYALNIPIVLSREEKMKAAYGSKLKPSGWEQTDPISHDPENYRYVVHTVSYDNDFCASLNGEFLREFAPESSHQQSRIRDLDGFLTRWISCSVVDEVHRGTYFQEGGNYHGFILDAPDDTIVAISTRDMGKRYSISGKAAEIDLAKEINARQNTPSATEFLVKCDQVYNEVILNGGQSQVKVNGIFLISDPFLGIPLYELDIRRFPGDTNQTKKLDEATTLASLLSVPLILIPEVVIPGRFSRFLDNHAVK